MPQPDEPPPLLWKITFKKDVFNYWTKRKGHGQTSTEVRVRGFRSVEHFSRVAQPMSGEEKKGRFTCLTPGSYRY